MPDRIDWTEPPADEAGAGHAHADAEWAETLARTIAHLAAQLTMTQIRLRALATELGEAGGVDPAAVQRRVAGIARAETETYLVENLGEALAVAIDVEALAAEIVEYLEHPAGE